VVVVDEIVAKVQDVPAHGVTLDLIERQENLLHGEGDEGHRALSVHAIDSPLERLFPRPTIEGLAWHYASHARLRDVVLVVARAVQGSAEAGADQVTPQAVTHAIAELSRDRGA
jgi:hypothetical protein